MYVYMWCRVARGASPAGQMVANAGQTGNFRLFFAFLCKCINDAPSNVLSLKSIIVSCIVIASYDVTSSCDVMTLLIMSSHMHMQQVM